MHIEVDDCTLIMHRQTDTGGYRYNTIRCNMHRAYGTTGKIEMNSRI